MDLHIDECASCRQTVAVLVGGGARTKRARTSPLAPASQPTPPSPRLTVGAHLSGRYRVLRMVGRGGMGEVYEVEDELLRERVALKVLSAELEGNNRANRRLKRELGLARRITHPNVCRVFDLGEDGGLLFVTMELLQGETLARRLRVRPRLAQVAQRRIAAQICAGLAAAHEAGVIHRDLKSENVLLHAPPVDSQDAGRVSAEEEVGDEIDRATRAVVMDFGLARSAVEVPLAGDDSTTLRGTVIGTLTHAAPEQLLGHPVTVAADIYALGILLFELVTGGSVPFPARTAAEAIHLRLRKQAPSPRAVEPAVDPIWEKAILRCLEREPLNRFPSVAAAVDALWPT
ncbi:MAG: serine/threonine-protein kinase [Myxococcales bacterium]